MQEDPVITSFIALRRYFFPLFLGSILVAVIGYGIANAVPLVYEVHFSYMISMDQKDTDPGFRYDGFYALSATDLFSSTIAGVASSPETIVAAYDRANLPLPTQNALRLTKSVVADKVAPQLVQFTVQDVNKQHAEALASQLSFLIGRTIDEYNEKGLSSVVFHGVSTQPWTGIQKVAPLPIALSLFVLVFLGGNTIILFLEAIKRGASTL